MHRYSACSEPVSVQVLFPDHVMVIINQHDWQKRLPGQEHVYADAKLKKGVVDFIWMGADGKTCKTLMSFSFKKLENMKIPTIKGRLKGAMEMAKRHLRH